MGEPPAAGKIRVMRIISRMNIGGPATHVVLLNEGLDRTRYDSLLVTGLESASEGNLRDVVAARGLHMELIPDLGREIDLRHDIVALYKLYRLMRREHPHIVHTHLAKAGFVGRLAARLARVPIVLHTYHGHVFHSYFGRTKTALFIALERACARLSDRIITISTRLRDEIAGFGVAVPERIEIVPLGFELDAFARESRRPGGFRAALGLPRDTPLVGAVGRLVKIKNLHLFLDAAALIRGRAPSTQFVLVGDGDLRQPLEDYAAALGLADAVTFTGWRRDLPAIYADLDVLVISSDNEGTPASLIEAMATGCPVVATRVGGVPDLLGDGARGRLVPANDAAALAAAILATLSGADATDRTASVARDYVLGQHQASRLVSDIDRLYGRLLREKHIAPAEAAIVEAM